MLMQHCEGDEAILFWLIAIDFGFLVSSPIVQNSIDRNGLGTEPLLHRPLKGKSNFCVWLKSNKPELKQSRTVLLWSSLKASRANYNSHAEVIERPRHLVTEMKLQLFFTFSPHTQFTFKSLFIFYFCHPTDSV